MRKNYLLVLLVLAWGMIFIHQPGYADTTTSPELALDFSISNDASDYYSGSNYPDTFIRDIGVTKDYFLMGLGSGSEVIAIAKDKNKVRVIANDLQAYGLFFGHGAASDNKSVWTSDYDHGNIFEFDIATGKLLKTWSVPFYTTRMDYDPWTKNLVLTAYNDANLYVYNRDGILQGTVSVKFCGSSMGVSVLKKGYLVLASPGAGDSDKILYFYDRQGNLKNQVPVSWGYWDIDYFQGDIYYDTPEGTIEKIPASVVFSVTDPETGEPTF